MAELKKCSTCKELKPYSEFHKNRAFKDGYCYSCKKCTNQINRESWKKFKDKRLLASKNWQQNNPEKVSLYHKKKYSKLRSMVYEGYGSKCRNCGIDDIRVLSIDHVNGNGRKERNKISPIQLLRQIIKNNFPMEYQLLCANCNTIKMYENKEFPGWASK